MALVLSSFFIVQRLIFISTNSVMRSSSIYFGSIHASFINVCFIYLKSMISCLLTSLQSVSNIWC